MRKGLFEKLIPSGDCGQIKGVGSHC
jgi:hypothetical protein